MKKWIPLLFVFPLILGAAEGENDRDSDDFNLRDKLMEEEKFTEDYYWREDVYGENPDDDPDSMQDYWEKQRSKRGR